MFEFSDGGREEGREGFDDGGLFGGIARVSAEQFNDYGQTVEQHAITSREYVSFRRSMNSSAGRGSKEEGEGGLVAYIRRSCGRDSEGRSFFGYV